MDQHTARRPGDDDPIGQARFNTKRPTLIGDVGFDAAYATESHPEGLRYGETPRAPGVEPHRPEADSSAEGPAVISIG
ncbi:hypothetical protein GCM10025771_11480 [Niveibacterium umoris]|uniref:Uncharacterized protein n=1 Tax=Niveibacterium umoris TaxID=1193620 RepID=A0A840BP96_9RHOO|nr:hypothetical protein [Niveibacterium umoris]MBB4013299.1 hypothetical protein [Niveibacterium umoris]